ncbi:hypothetical protein [Rhizosphaericola mali]|uniref:Uncharacterized protein n=1 Tax=Rhizosphaericola mali TaxID=2545455 RepID=A0A5P2G357_9BACT|nr:hypothetical protein [Rhizosphaericola mali]QES90236.1 hypothetical protein E0W69_016790 [Rhizosphaericola mali]
MKFTFTLMAIFFFHFAHSQANPTIKITVDSLNQRVKELKCNAGVIDQDQSAIIAILENIKKENLQGYETYWINTNTKEVYKNPNINILSSPNAIKFINKMYPSDSNTDSSKQKGILILFAKN